jgi:PBP1b-binding outer membrane lipoprotein LpoB
MKSVLCVLCVCVALCGCSEPTTAPAPARTPTVTSLLLTYDARDYEVPFDGPLDQGGKLPVGKIIQIDVIALFSDGSQQGVTAGTTWLTADANVATVSATGRVQGVGVGTAMITATYQGAMGMKSFPIIP